MNLLNYDQTHTVNANLTLQTPKNFGFTLGALHPLANWVANAQFSYGSGLPYSSYGSGMVNDQRLPWTSTTDIKLMRRMNLVGLNLDFFIDVFNLFNKRNVNWIGSSQYYEIAGDPRIVGIDNITGDYLINSQVYSAGRQARIGFALQF